MKALRILLGFVFAGGIAAVGLPAAAQSTTLLELSPGTAVGTPLGRSYLGINVSRLRGTGPCAATSMLCDGRDRPSQLYAGTMVGNFWGAEFGYFNSGRFMRDGGEGRTQGLNLSLVGRARLGNSFGVYGKLGTTYGRSENLLLGPGSEGFGLSFGGGMSYDFTPRLSARLEWDSHDLRFGGMREPVRSTSLGLRYRY